MPNNIISVQKDEFCDLNAILGGKIGILSWFEAKLGQKMSKNPLKLVKIGQNPPNWGPFCLKEFFFIDF